MNLRGDENRWIVYCFTIQDSRKSEALMFIMGGKTRTSGRAFICHRTGLFQRDGRKNARAATPTDGLRIKRLDRDEEWFDCIFSNRNGKSDLLSGYDVIIGPIANDILYDVFGIPTSGFLNREQSLQLLLVGPVYTQVVIRTEKAAEQLTWLSSEVLDHEKIMLMQQAMLREQEEYQALFAEKMEKIADLQ